MLRGSLLPVFFAGIFLIISGCDTIEPTNFSNGAFATSADTASGPIAEACLLAGNTVELSVEVDGKMEVSMHRAMINNAGYMTLPLVGDVKIGGLYLDGARQLIGKTYGRYFVNPPVVMISLIEEPGLGEWGHITVTGRVESPGRVKILSPKGMKLTAVVQEAGGFSGSAKKSDIRVTRIDASGRKIRISVNYDEIGQDGNADADVTLKDGDIVYIPERIF